MSTHTTAIVLTREDGQVYAAEHNGDCWQSVFPSDEAENSALHGSKAAAVEYLQEFLSAAEERRLAQDRAANEAKGSPIYDHVATAAAQRLDLMHGGGL